MHVDSEWDSELDAEGEVDEDYEQVTEAEVAPVAAAVSPAEREGTLANLPPLCTFPYGYTFAAQYGTAAETQQMETAPTFWDTAAYLAPHEGADFDQLFGTIDSELGAEMEYTF
jgi:hypothetical protein